MHSCNAPVPPEIARLARGLASECFDATPRDRHTLVVKRLGEGNPPELARQIRSKLSGAAPFEARITGIDLFQNPPVGQRPVAYLAIESPGIMSIHRELCECFEPVEGFEGDEYDPHVTIARGGDAGKLADRGIEPITWTVESLFVWSPEYGEPVERLSLPI